MCKKNKGFPLPEVHRGGKAFCVRVDLLFFSGYGVNIRILSQNMYKILFRDCEGYEPSL